MTRLKNLSDINTNTKEGRYLMAALAKITTESQTDKTPDEVLEQCYTLQAHMYTDATPIPEDVVEERPTFAKELETLINKHSVENGSNTPDFILSKYIVSSLINWEETVNKREEWYGHKTRINN